MRICLPIACCRPLAHLDDALQAVLPVGPVPREALDDYFELISR